jgi:hypothetical protein
MNGLVHYLTENCCGGNPCVPVCAPACAGEGDTASCTLSIDRHRHVRQNL